MTNPTPSDWLALAERAEKATGADDELDWRIHAALLRWPSDVRPREPGHRPISSSLDATTALISEKLLGRSWGVTCERDGTGVASMWPPEAYGCHTASAVTPALALVAVFCRAMAEKEKSNEAE